MKQYPDLEKALLREADPAGRLAVALVYNGAKYCGWQVQKNAHSVQEHMQDALCELLGFRPDISGCSRTDSGVHAMHYVFHMSAANVTIPAERLSAALNTKLHGSGIAVKSVTRVPGEFHARYLCEKKEYIYKIWNAPYPNPFYEGRAWTVPYPLDLGACTFVSRELQGTHDFRTFMSKGSKITEDTVRTVDYFTFCRQGGLITLSVCADGFLYNMVRIMVGTFILAATGKIHSGDVSAMLLSQDRSLAGDTAPACGLYLNKVIYPEKYGVPAF